MILSIAEYFYVAQQFALDASSQILVLQQMNEWAVMVYMIKYQNGKLLEEIVQEMSNLESRNAFRRKEASINFGFVALVVLYFALVVFLYLPVFGIISYHKYYWISLFCLECFCVLTLVLLLVLGCALLYQLRTKYHFAYENQKDQMMLFIFTEAFGLIIIIYVNILLLQGHIDEGLSIWLLYTFTGLRTTIQAIGFIKFKKAQDPLEEIQQMEYMNLVSTVQIMTTDYIEKID